MFAECTDDQPQMKETQEEVENWRLYLLKKNKKWTSKGENTNLSGSFPTNTRDYK